MRLVSPRLCAMPPSARPQGYIGVQTAHSSFSTASAWDGALVCPPWHLHPPSMVPSVPLTVSLAPIPHSVPQAFRCTKDLLIMDDWRPHSSSISGTETPISGPPLSVPISQLLAGYSRAVSTRLLLSSTQMALALFQELVLQLNVKKSH